MKLGMQVGLGPGHIMLHGEPAPFTQRGGAAQFLAHVYCGQTAACVKMPLGTQVGFGRKASAYVRPARRCVRWGLSSPPIKGHSPQFSANVRCGQAVGLTKMPLGMEVGLGPGDFVFDGDPATPEKRAHLPHPILAHVHCDQMAGWIKMTLSMEVNVGSGDVVLDGVAAPP